MSLYLSLSEKFHLFFETLGLRNLKLYLINTKLKFSMTFAIVTISSQHQGSTGVGGGETGTERIQKTHTNKVGQEEAHRGGTGLLGHVHKKTMICCQ